MIIKKYYYLTKPGIIYGNSLAAAAGFLLASKGHVDFLLLLATLLGLGFIIGSACVFNNIFDSDIDGHMDRTKKRAIVTGKISQTNAASFGAILGLLGVIILSVFTTPYALLTALIGWLVYVAVYTPLKRRTVHATLVGSIAGATPPVVGYTAVTNQIDLTAILLFLILTAWQMPHFYAIAVYRLKDYTNALVPVLPIKKGINATKIYIISYIIIYIIISVLFYYYSITGLAYLLIMSALGLAWLWMSIKGFKTSDDTLWAKKMFRFSLIVLMAFSIMISINYIV